MKEEIKIDYRSYLGWRSIFFQPIFYPLLCVITLLIEMTSLTSISIFLLDNPPLMGLNIVGFIFAITFCVLLFTFKILYAPIKYISILILLIYPMINIGLHQSEAGAGMFYFPPIILLIFGLHSDEIDYRRYSYYNLLLIVLLAMGIFFPNMGIDPASPVHGAQIGSAVLLFVVLLVLHYQWQRAHQKRKVVEGSLVEKVRNVVKTFSKILAKENNLETILWKVASESIPALDLEDCVIYLIDEKRNVLVQKAAYGAKSPLGDTIVQPMDIPVGRGIVGAIAATGKPEIIPDTTKDHRYIPDDSFRHSEIAVPILIDDKVIGVIDSEHPAKDFFGKNHLYLLQLIATLCASKITEWQHMHLQEQSQKLEEEASKLQELDEMKSNFIANLSHDLKTPLTLIIGPSENLLKNSSGESKQAAELIYKNSIHLKEIIDQLLELNQVAFMMQKLNPQRVNIGNLMRKWLSQYHTKAQAKSIIFQIHGPENLLAPADEKKLSVVVHNLVDNALKYTPKNGTVFISYGIENNEFKLEVADSGVGIAPEYREKIFERFYRIGAADGKGTGIGLSLVKELTQVMGGKIEVGDSKLGGAKFYFSYNLAFIEGEVTPTLSNEGEKTEITLAKVPDTDKPIVLVVEDHPDMQQFVTNTIGNNYYCLTADNGLEGLKIARQVIPDLIISDLMMPEMDGEEMCKHIREDERTSHIPIIVLSAKSRVMDRVTLYQLGADNYLVKPFDSKELTAMVAALIAQRTRLREKFKTSFFEANHITEFTEFEEDPFLEKVTGIIMEHIDDHEFSMVQLCDMLNLGRNQVQRKIKALTDMTPVEFVRFTRLKEAKSLLNKGDYNVSEVAYMVGFNNLSYFTRMYKQTFSVLPSEEK